MASEIFLTLDGITGESQKDGAKGWIEIFSFSNGASNPSSVAFGTGSGAGKVDISSISIQKQTDSASPLLFLSCCNGKHFSTGTLMVREAGGDSKVVFFQYDLTQVFIDSISWGGAEGGGKPSESLSVSCQQIVVTYFPQNADGGKGTKQVGGWSVLTNTAAAG
jgi:type VI secretion system secreted protein Hcp